MKVLYVDYSVGFGGSFKSLALTWRGLPEVEKLLLTTQDTALVREWFPRARVHTFRRRINHRTRNRVEARFRGPVSSWAALKAYAIADLGAQILATARIAWTARRHGVDLVHVNNTFIPEAVLGAWLARVRCVVHVRGFPAPSEAPATAPDSWLLRLRAARAVAQVIGVSNAICTSLDGIDAPRMTVFDPVDFDIADRAATRRAAIRAEYGFSDAVVVAAIFGRVIPWKGQLEFVRAAAEAMRHAPELRALVVGDESDGGREYVATVREVIRASGMADRFTLTGYRANVDDYYAASDIVVHASIEPEPFGMVVSEGMAASRPVIAANAGGPSEVIADGVDGLLVPPGDVHALANALLTLTTDSALRARMGVAGRRKALELFSIGANASSIRGVYERLVARERVASPARARS